MYGDRPVEWKPADLDLVARCPVSVGKRRTRTPASALDRWKALHDALVQWMADGRPTDTTRIEDDLFGSFDPLQRELVTAAFARSRDVIGEAALEPDPVAARVVSDDGRVVLRVPFQFTLVHPDGDREVLRLKSARPSTDDEAAVVTLGTDAGDNPGDLLADPGQVEPIEQDPLEARQRVDRLITVATAERGTTPVPGFHCWRCDRPAVCGAYPDPWGLDIPSSARTVKVSRTTLAHLGTCERRVAWKSLFAVPFPDRDVFDTPSPGRGLGSVFHAMIASALLDADPARVVAAAAEALAPSERDDLLLLWESHLALVEAEPHPVAVTAAEHPFGVTLPVPDLDTAVVAIGTIDAAGRESDGTAAVVEHRTGAAATIPPLEAELYAVATWMATGADRVAVHHHHLRAPIADACTRQVFEGAHLEAALADLLAAARTIAGWDADDALAAPHTPGEWCVTCDHEATCRRWRT